MTRLIHRTSLAGAVAGALAILATAQAQQPVNCHPDVVLPYGRDMRQFSRNTAGFAGGGPDGIVYFYKCPGTGVVTRFTYRQPFRMELTVPTGCDECPDIIGTIQGFLYTETRMNDPYQTNQQNARIGWHTGFGNLVDTTGKVIGTVKFQGTIGTNSSRAPLPIIPIISGTPGPSCFECGHYTGQMTITFPSTATVPSGLGTIQAFYQFEGVIDPAAPCDQVPPCEIGFKYENGTLDGINRRPCKPAAG